MSGIKLILLFCHICIVYVVGDDVGGIDQKPILQEKNEPGIPENRGVCGKAGATECNATTTACPRRPTKWHFNVLVGRCETVTSSFCGGKENAFERFQSNAKRIAKKEVNYVTPERLSDGFETRENANLKRKEGQKKEFIDGTSTAPTTSVRDLSGIVVVGIEINFSYKKKICMYYAK
uniref:Secreted protein n=1 Tax=Ixodes ricinus TaxID=34613 RepID=V5H9T3_IXORI